MLSWVIPQFSSNEYVKVAEYCWLEDQFSDDMYTSENIFFPEKIRNSVLKRRREYFYGRLCARAAIRKLLPDFNGVVETNEDRSPDWPFGIVGSISHCDYFAICVCISEENALAVGVDAENMLSSDLADRIASSIVKRDELNFRSTQSWPFAAILTLAFSAKESLYKALYPLVHKFFGFWSVDIIGVDPCSHSFTLRLADDIGGRWHKGMIFEGRYIFQGTNLPNLDGRVVTTIIIPNENN